MFEKFAKTPAKTVAPKQELTLTTAFVQALSAEGLRLSYAALAGAARILGEDLSGQIPAQRGAKLVKSLPATLQPFVCRKSGGYAKGVVASFGEDAPKGLVDLPVITAKEVAEAVGTWEDAVG
jgi:hypothetical protein